VPENEVSTPLPVLSGAWTMDAPFTIVTGLWHLEGEVVQVLADGNVLSEKTVVDGRITLDTAATKVIVGEKYRGIIKTLPPTSTELVIEAKRKRIVGVNARTYQTRGLKAGTRLSQLYEFKERSTEAADAPPDLQMGIKPIKIDSTFNYDSPVYFVQDNPLHASILGFITDIELGDVDSRGR